MEWIEPIVIGLGVLSAGLIFGGWASSWARVEFIGYWPLAWAVILAGGAAQILSDRIHEILYLSYVLGSLFPALLLAGAFRYAERAVPRWLIPVSLALGGVRAISGFGGWETGAYVPALVFEPLVATAAAVVVYRAAGRPSRSLLHRLIAPGLLLVAIVEAVDAASSLRDGAQSVPWLPWLLVGVPLAALQSAASFAQIQARAESFSEALEKSVSLLQATLDSTTDGLIAVDRQGDLTSFNQNLVEMWRVPREILEEGDGNKVLAFAAQQMKEPQAFSDKVRYLLSRLEEKSFDTLELEDGRIFERYSRPQRIGQEIVGRVWSFRDVTDRRRAEAAMARQQGDLEELVQERTRELVESRNKLLQADRLATVGTLAAGVAHQINNPIGTILNSAEYALLCENDDDAKAVWKRALDTNVEEARRCGAIVRSMLQFARREPTEKWVEDLNHVVRRVCRATSSYAHNHAAEVVVETAEVPLPVFMSPIELEQVLVNLVRNGIGSLDAGGCVEVSSERRGSHARLQVCDNGRGVEAKHLDRIFDPFFSTRLQQGGTGLGLSVAHGIVLDHGGEIRIDSEPGKGTSLVIELPLCEDLSNS